MQIKLIFNSLKTYSYFIFATVIFIFELILISKGQWAGDFWEHAAVIKELTKNLLHPTNPIIKSNIPHAFFSPYSVLVAVFARITNLSSIEVLKYFAFFNFIFFLVTFYWFCKNLFKEKYNSIATIGLFLILILWGSNPPLWSGFYHLYTLHYVLPYPSTFAISISFAVFSLLLKNKVKYKVISVLIILLSAIVLLTHPTTAIFLFVGIVTINLILFNNSLIQAITKSAILIIPCILVCLLWPYYNFLSLIFSNNPDFHIDSRELYFNVLLSNWPLLLMLPCLLLVPKDRVVLFVLTFISILAIIYISGFVFKAYGVGRLISNIYTLADILIAYLLISLIKKRSLAGNFYLTTLILSLILSIYLNRSYLRNTIDILNSNNISYHKKYNFLRSFISSSDLILSDEKSNIFIPAFNGKVISTIRPLYWVNDINERRKSIDIFFSNKTTTAQKETIIKKYKPDYILIDHSELKPDNTFANWVKSIGNVVYEKDQLDLVKIKKSN